MSELSPEVLRAAARSALAALQPLAGRTVDAQVLATWATDLPAAQARIGREATQVGIVGHLHGDLARGLEALYEAPLLRPSADETAGRLLRIVHVKGEPELEEHTPDGAPWHWSTAHPDPVPPLRAQATGLQAERAALTEEDLTTCRDVTEWERRVGRLQQDVVHLTGAVGDAERTATEAARHCEGEETRLARALSGRDAVQERLPGLLATPPTTGVRGLSAAVLAQFHPGTLDELAREEASVERARKALAAARAVFEDADARACNARARLASHEQKLTEARRSLADAVQRRTTLRRRADQLSRKRLSLAQQMDDAAEARRSTLADDLAARLHGDPRGRLRLRWPHGGLGDTVIALVAPGTLSTDPVLRRAAEDALATRADALLVCAALGDPPAPDRARTIRRMARSCPRVALVFTDDPVAERPAAEGATADAARARRQAARNAWAEALGVSEDQVLAVVLCPPDPTTPDPSGSQTLRLARRERVALGQALLHGPPVARAAAVAQAIRATASRVDAELRRRESGHAQRLAQLEAQRIDDPAAFALDRRDDITRNLAPVAERARAATRTAIEDALRRAEHTLVSELRGARDEPTLVALREQLPDRVSGLLRELESLAARASARAQAQAVDQLIDLAITPLSERVRLTAQATRPPDTPPVLEADETAEHDAVLQQLQAALDKTTAGSPAPAVLAGGAIGAALLGPLGALLGAGAGAWANKVSASLEKRRAETIRLVEQTFDQARATLGDRATHRLDGAELRIAAAVDARLLPTLDRFMAWWADQRDELRRQAVAARVPQQRLAEVRDQLVARAVELDQAIAGSTHTAGVLATPAYVASLPPPPPPLV